MIYNMNGYTTDDKNVYIEYLINKYGIEPDEYEQLLNNKLNNNEYKTAFNNYMHNMGNKNEFTSGVFIENTQYPNIIKCSINVNKFSQDNYMTRGGYVRFLIKKAKSGKWYAVNPKY